MSTPNDVAVAVQALAAAVAASATNPADAIRVLMALSATPITNATPSSATGLAMASMQTAAIDVMRRAAVVAIARASAIYQPSSVIDAAAIRATVCAALDAEILLAGDQHDDATYSAMRALRAAVSADLTRRGAGLPTVAVVSSATAMPALALAQRIYRDASKSDGLLAQAAAIHPAFMPTRFKALSK